MTLVEAKKVYDMFQVKLMDGSWILMSEQEINEMNEAMKVIEAIAKYYGLKDEPLSNYPKATFNASPDR